MTQTPLIFLPGLLCDAALWQYQTDALAADTHIEVADFNGLGSIEAMAAHVLATAPPRFSIAALSMGGYVAFEIMRQAGPRVEKLALFNTSARADDDEATQRRLGLIKLAQSGKFKGVTPRMLPFLIHPSRVTEPALSSIILSMAERVGADNFIQHQHAIIARTNSLPFLANIHQPVLIVGGSDDYYTPSHLQQEIAAGIPHASLHILPQCGHLAPLEYPDRVNALLRAFLFS